jgi:hypothetical protein
MRWRILVSLLSLAIICFGVGYAVGRERLRDPDHLHALYQETNDQFFATWDVMDLNDVHGPPFQQCMKRFAEKE